MNLDQKEEKAINLGKRNFLKTANEAFTALDSVVLSDINKLSHHQLKDMLQTVPETLPNGGERLLPNYEVAPLRSDIIIVAHI